MSEKLLPSEARPTNAITVERRAHVRYAPAPDTTCQLTAGGNNNVWWASVLDISAGGIGLVVSRRFEPGTLLAIGVENKSREFSHMLVARVVHVRKESASRYIMGAKFISPLGDDELRALLEDSPAA
ncbi:MAG TPA: PilZ domain-containing protein [Gemmataceae bacterium]|jgi:c-di-GMP-binding flagellar brake protein YcgR|nr:PilZ domain-containing protein [Gemmataceae bacterium]